MATCISPEGSLTPTQSDRCRNAGTDASLWSVQVVMFLISKDHHRIHQMFYMVAARPDSDEPYRDIPD
ncbi:hypothetical protein K8T06_17620 [bacterium]|nr:hypothetical protein [bacterium]